MYTIIAEIGRFCISNVHGESMIIRYKSSDSASLQKMVYDTSLKKKNTEYIKLNNLDSSKSLC